MFERNKVCDNHFGHNVHVFGAPQKYCSPICNVLTKLNAGMPIHINEAIIFKLSIDLGELDKFNKVCKAEPIMKAKLKKEDQMSLEFKPETN